MKLSSLDTEISRIKAELTGFDSLDYFKQNRHIDAHYTTAIGGNTLSYADTLSVLKGMQPSRGSLYEINEVIA